MNRRIATLAAIILMVLTIGCAAAVAADDPGPHLQYGGTPIELHFDSGVANLTRVLLDDGTKCVIVSADNQRSGASYTVAVDCNFPTGGR